MADAYEEAIAEAVSEGFVFKPSLPDLVHVAGHLCPPQGHLHLPPLVLWRKPVNPERAAQMVRDFVAKTKRRVG